MQRIEITWSDASYYSSTWSRRDLRKDRNLTNLESCGWFVEEKDDCYIVALEHCDDTDTFRHICAIPKSSVLSVRKFSVKRKIR